MKLLIASVHPQGGAMEKVLEVQVYLKKLYIWDIWPSSWGTPREENHPVNLYWSDFKNKMVPKDF